jgi:hypothetical protein
MERRVSDEHWKQGYLRGLAWVVLMADHLPECEKSNLDEMSSDYVNGFREACNQMILACFARKTELNNQTRTKTHEPGPSETTERGSEHQE